MKFVLFPLLATGIADGAMAKPACPVATDMLEGIVVGYADDSLELFVRAHEKVSVIMNYEDGDEVGSQLLLFGTYFAQSLSLAGDADAQYIMLGDIENLRYGAGPPRPDSAWSEQVEWMDVYTTGQIATPYIVHISAEWRAADVRTIGDCTYDVVPGRTVITFPFGDVSTIDLAYIPELGFSVIDGTYDIVGAPGRTKKAIFIEAAR